MKLEITATLMIHIARSYELLNDSKILVSELERSLEHSRKLLDKSRKLIARLKPESIFKDP